MKKIFIALFPFLTISCTNALAQSNDDVIIGATEEEYAIRAEVQLEFTETLFCQSTKDSIDVKTEFYSPLFIQFNKADLNNFLKNPAAFTDNADPFLSTTYVWSDQQNNIEIVPGYMKVHEKSSGKNMSESWKRDITGEIGTALYVDFSILNIAESLNKSEKAAFTLLFKLSSCPACEEKNVTGSATLKENNGETMTITEHLQMNPSFSHEDVFSPASIQAVMDVGLVETTGEKKEQFEENFRKQFYATAPKIDAEKLIRFLLNPSESLEIPFEGHIFGSGDCRHYQKYKGTIKLDGDEVYKFASE